MPSIDNKVSLGKIITIVTVIAAAAVGWGVLTTTVDGLSRQVDELKALSPRVAALETKQAVTTTSLTAIHSGIDELKSDLDETNRLIRALLQQRN